MSPDSRDGSEVVSSRCLGGAVRHGVRPPRMNRTQKILIFLLPFFFVPSFSSAQTFYSEPILVGTTDRVFPTDNQGGFFKIGSFVNPSTLVFASSSEIYFDFMGLSTNNSSQSRQIAFSTTTCPFAFGGFDVGTLPSSFDSVSGVYQVTFGNNFTLVGGTTYNLCIYGGGDNVSYFSDSSENIVGMIALGSPSPQVSTFEVYTPLANYQTASTSVLFSYDVFVASSSFTFACAEISSITNQQNLAPLCRPILSSGVTSFNATTTLVTGNSYSWRPYLLDSVNGIRFNSDWIIPFGIVSTSGTTTPYFVPSLASSTNPTFLDFVNIPSLLQRKLPFSLFYDVNNILQGIDQIPASSAPTAIFDFIAPSASTTFPALYSSLTDVELFSTSTVTELVPEEVSSLFLLIQQATIWFFAVMTCYKLTFRVFQKQ